jgi:hypothetical protein
VIVQPPAAKSHTRRERIMIAALVAIVAADVLHWVAPLFR